MLMVLINVQEMNIRNQNNGYHSPGKRSTSFSMANDMKC